MSGVFLCTILFVEFFLDAVKLRAHVVIAIARLRTVFMNKVCRQDDKTEKLQKFRLPVFERRSQEFMDEVGNFRLRSVFDCFMYELLPLKDSLKAPSN